MWLAAISFADPMMLVGLVAALAPVILHLLNRTRAPVVEFPTLRFLRITAQKTARRRQIQQYFLLLVRIVVFALIAMAVAAPLIRGGNPVLAYGFMGLLLVGLALVVLALTMGGEKRETQNTKRETKDAGDGKKTAGRRWAMASVLLLLALGLAGYSTYGLASDQFFAPEKAGEFSGQSTAMVIILDNSHSMLARLGTPGETRLARAKELARRLLAGDMQPREAAILPTNPSEDFGTPALSGNMFAVAGNLEKIAPTGSAKPIQERLATALALLNGSMQPSKMVVIVSDFARPAFADAEALAPLKKLPEERRKDLQVVLMPVTPADAPTADVGITAFGLAEGTQRPAVGAEVTFEGQVLNNADSADVREVVLVVDGKPVEAMRQRVQLGAAGSPTARATVRMTYRLASAGVHRLALQLADPVDAMPWDDARDLVLDVAEPMRVLVVGADSGPSPRARSAAFYFQAALGPYEGAAQAIPWPIKPTYRGVDQLPNAAALRGYSAMFLCDVPRVSPGLADALAAYTKTGGGRVAWVLGPSVDAAAYNQVLMPRGLLPGPLGRPVVTLKAQPIDWVDVRSGLFMNLFDSQEPFRSALVTGRWTLGEGSGGRVLAKLGDDSPVMIRHAAPGSADSGRIFTLLTTPGAEWSNLGGTVLLVPLATRMALGDYPEAGSATSYETGQSVPVTVTSPGAIDVTALRRLTVDVTTPGGAVINVKAAEGSAALWTFDRAREPGVYSWKTSDGRYAGAFAVNPPGEEADLFPADVAVLAKESIAAAAGEAARTIVARDVQDLLGQLAHRGEGTTLMPGFLAMVLILAVGESLLANRHRGE
jgi:hypothetical protein